jgi:asparagine synthase (glutamine-hydrolysing)
MCGIAGIIGPDPGGDGILSRMVGTLVHRGPDDSGSWIDPEAGVFLGHRRLAIVDLSPLGHQPMASADGRYVLSYNGEIYNHWELRTELGAPETGWRGHSDTETLIECIAAWGLKRTLEKSVGMFALALWDRRERLLHLARDRFGEKPLYYGWTGGDFVFASELKAIRTHPRFGNPISRRALTLYVSRGYVPAPFSIHDRIFKLEPGCILTASAEAASIPLDSPPAPGARTGPVSIDRYWCYREVVSAGLRNPILDEQEALEQLEQTLAAAIRGQAVADVPVGAFLSGGIDSSTIVALYQKYASSLVRTFSIGFEEAEYDEAPFARQVAAHLGTEHHEHYVGVAEARDVIPLLPAMYDEPFADSSQVPTYLVSRFAREQVTVALSGDGGDELFGGYTRYHGAATLWGQLKRMPAPVRAAVGGTLGRMPPAAWQALATALPNASRRPHFGAKVQKGLQTLGAARTLGDVYDSFLDEWQALGTPVLGADGRDQGGYDLDLGVAAPDTVRMMYCDATTYLPDDILCKVDRAAMAVSLETRVPFLDHRVAELAARIPVAMKIRDGRGKHILRQMLYREAPQRLFERPKAGFGIPVGEWLRGPLRPWAEALLDQGRLEREGLFDAAKIRRRWQAHLARKSDSTAAIWAILMFQAWQETAAPAPAGANRPTRSVATASAARA